MGKCKFVKEWLDRKDDTGYKISLWAEKRGDDCFCIVCDRNINVGSGFTAIKQHYETSKHKSNYAKEKDINQMHLVDVRPGSPIRLYSVKDSAYTAELIWAMKICCGNVSANFSHGIADTFKAMFPTEGAIPEGFSLNPTKIGYLITDALGPYFRSKILKDLGSSYFTLMYDETTNNSGAKELQTAIRFWSNDANGIVSHHLETFNLGHATADVLQKNIFLAINNANLEASKLLMIGSDAPSVNKKVFALMNEEVKSLRGKGLLDCGFCSIHLIHNAFQKGLEELGSDASDLIIALYYYFHNWPARWEDFSDIQEKMNVAKRSFLKHVSSRWLTIEPAARRVLEQWDAIIEYFLKFIPLHQRGSMKTNSYARIVTALKRKSVKAELKFVCISSSLFTDFTLMFQSNVCLIHLLYEHLRHLVIKIMTRCCKSEAIKAFKEHPSSDTIFSERLLLSADEFVMCEEMKSLIGPFSTKEKTDFITQMLKHYTVAAKYIVNSGVVQSKILRSFTCLKPDNIKKKVSVTRLRIMAASLPVHYDEEKLIDEWKLLQLEDLKSNNRIDHFWSQLSGFKTANNDPKYPNILSVVKPALSLSHGNADVERGFSKSARVLTVDRASMSVRTLNARLNISDGLRKYDDKPHCVPITEELIKLARTAHKSYELYLEDQRQKADEEKKRKMEREKAKAIEDEKIKKLEESRKDISKLQSELQSAKGSESLQKSAMNELLDDAHKKLQDAIKKKDFSKAQVAQAMLEGAMKKNDECNLKRKAIDSLGKKIDKEKDSVITNFFSKRPKPN